MAATRPLNRDPRSLFAKYPRHPEDYAYMNSNKLPAQFIAAEQFYWRALQRPIWRHHYEGKWVAILGTKPNPGIIEGDRLEAVLHDAYSAWGYRPIVYALVGKEEVRRSLPPPQPAAFDLGAILR